MKGSMPEKQIGASNRSAVLRLSAPQACWKGIMGCEKRFFEYVLESARLWMNGWMRVTWFWADAITLLAGEMLHDEVAISNNASVIFGILAQRHCSHWQIGITWEEKWTEKYKIHTFHIENRDHERRQEKKKIYFFLLRLYLLCVENISSHNN